MNIATYRYDRSIHWALRIGLGMACICLCGQRYQSDRQAVGCGRCAERKAARRPGGKAARRRSKNASTSQRRPPPTKPGRKSPAPLDIRRLSAHEAVCAAVTSYIKRIGLPDKDVLAAGSPVSAALDHIVASCGKRTDLARLYSEAATFGNQRPSITALEVLVHREFEKRIQVRSARNRRNPAIIRTVVGGGLPGLGRRR